MKTQSRRSLAAALAVLVFMGDSGFALQTATIGVGKIKDLSIRMYGFVETDVIADTTAGFTEEMDSNLVPMRTAAGGGGSNFSGQTHRTEMSIRNSRLGFALGLPKSGGLSAKAVLELDFMGNNAPNTAPGSAPGAQSERDFFNNPAVRVRHAYLDLDYDGLDGKIGQYWSLLGWQPYYFPGEAVLLPSPAMLYRRFAQVRAAYAFKPAEGWTLQAAADLAKPAQMKSGSP
ncbi:MAG: hypothetical protein KGK30_04815, partial [Elusimicrobia bacterium]|nr:hypothetical protein [Elusimicrobiota bacterium]